MTFNFDSALYISGLVQPGMPSTETAYICQFPELTANRKALNCKFKNVGKIFELYRLMFYFFSNLYGIVAEFYDVDVGTAKRIEIKPRRIKSSFLGTDTWNLNEVGR